MRKKLINIFKKIGYAMFRNKDIYNYISDINNTQVAQKQLFFFIQTMKKNDTLPDFNDAGFRAYSQNDEDGKLLYIFALIGFTNRICVEIACGRPQGSNCANLIVNWGWTGLLIDDNPECVESTKQYYQAHDNTEIHPPKVIKSWVSAENINNLIKQNGIAGEIDLLSIDVSGIDYWLWKNLEIINPRVVVIEYNSILGPDKSITVPYKSSFDRFKIHNYYNGASLKAVIKLAKQKGYKFIGVNQYQYNAFFIKKNLSKLPSVEINSCFTHPKVLGNIKNYWPKIKNLNWVKV